MYARMYTNLASYHAIYILDAAEHDTPVPKKPAEGKQIAMYIVNCSYQFNYVISCTSCKLTSYC